jgi:hypothetical protein
MKKKTHWKRERKEKIHIYIHIREKNIYIRKNINKRIEEKY